LQSQDLQMNQEITFLSDGDDTLRELQLAMSPKATHILDWFHLTMKFTVLGQYGNGLVQCEAVLGEQIPYFSQRLYNVKTVVNHKEFCLLSHQAFH